MTLASFFQDPDFIQSCYILAAILFIVGLTRLSSPATARSGNAIAAVGMFIAIAATLLQEQIVDYELIALGIVIGTIVGVPSARAVKMTAMPQMVALFNGVGGGAAALIAWVEFREAQPTGPAGDQAQHLVSTDVMIFLMFSTIVGAVSFFGSLIAFGKLQELISGRPILIKGQQVVNALILLAVLAGAVYLVAEGPAGHENIFVGVLALSAVLGVLMVLPIGGADMPVVISMLNAFTGLAAASAGFTLDNTALIVAGTLVGASGTILTRLMSEAMNRSLGNVLFAGFGAPVAVGPGDESAEGKSYRSTSADDVAIQLAYANKVVVVPGYGMAVAQAQHVVRELSDELEKRGVEVEFAIHPVAGRMPGHMNVLLAEADVSYDKLKEMDEINPEFPTTDVSLVIGANDVTNPAARSNESSPIYGMPILDVDKSHSVIVLKRSMNPGFAGIENELYYAENTAMLFGDAKSSVAAVLAEVKALG
ncbi:MAG: H+-translocating transhydrogenase subunit beta [Solirubrobacteraceae bacterium]|nr:H+-translocating transhydrogenase subunit beta [Solirubrobacteraceae bacterium]